MCQSLVHKVGRSQQLLAVAEPGILNLFESWLDELEEEAAAFLKKQPEGDVYALAAELGLSRSGATFLLAKLQAASPTP